MTTPTTSSSPVAADAPDPTIPTVPRLDLHGPWPDGLRAMRAFDAAVGTSGLEGSLVHLVRQRASQVNGCAYCLDMHSKDALAAGETEQRLHVLPAWREVPLFTPRERAALALTEAVTLITEGHVPDEVLDAARLHFAADELLQLLFAIVVINSWNRLSISARPPLTYEPAVARPA
jgi:AhpD family alkylhydroperoxidase